MCKIDTELIENYRAMKIERNDISQRIKRIEKELDVYGQQSERDVVKGGRGGEQRYTVEGVNDRGYSSKRTELQEYKLKLEQVERAIKRDIGTVERTINEIGSPEKRTIIRLHYMDGLSWKLTAERMGGGYTEDAVRISAKRYLRKLREKK